MFLDEPGVRRAAIVGLLVVAVGPSAAAQDDEPPAVEIIATTGAVDGPVAQTNDQPNWERVRLEIRVVNRLRQAVRDLEVELTLLAAGGGTASRPIPGWSFREVFADPIPGASAKSDLRFVKQLPRRRRAPPADEIAYRVRVLSYRLAPPDLGTAIELLGSPQRAAQRAAILSYDRTAARSLDRSDRRAVQNEVVRVLRTEVADPTASNALRMLIALRAVGTFGLSSELPALLTLPERSDRADWGRAMIELASRMIAASERDDPRLRVLPRWAREQTALLTVRAEDALPDAVRDGILQMGDAAVPELLVQANRAPSAAARTRAQRLLDRLGRSTVPSQLQLRDTEARVRVIRAFGKVGAPEPVPALIDLLRGPDAVVSLEVARALEDIGPATVPALVAALGERDDARVLSVLDRIVRRAPQAIRRAARAEGMPAAPPRRLLATLGAIRRAAKLRQRTDRLRRALVAGRAGRFVEALAALDEVFDREPELYMRHAVQIGSLYENRARFLYVQGNYDAAVRTLKTGLTVHRTDAALDLLADAQLALVFGFIELDDLQQAEEVLAQVASNRRTETQRRLRAELLAAHARNALAGGRYSVARTLVDRARKIHPDIGLEALQRRLLVIENFAVVVVMGLLAAASLLAGFLLIRRRWQRARLLRSARLIDQLDATQF